MLRRILAAFALLTGLAASGVPAEARLLTAVSLQAEASVPSQQPGPRNPCSSPAQRNGVVGDDRAADCRPQRSVIIYLPTVQLGPDRAHE